MNKSETDKTDVKQIAVDSRPWLFKPGQSGNLKGRPKGVATDPVKELIEIIATHKIRITAKRRAKLGLKVDVGELTTLEHILLDWATSLSPAKQQMFMERYAGKVANVNLNQNSSFDFMKHADKFTDAELEAIRDGADPLDILFSKLPSVVEDNNE